MALLSGTWYAREAGSLGRGGVIKRSNIDTNDRIRIDANGIAYYDANNDWVVDSKDIVIGALVYASTLAKSTGIFTQDPNRPTSFLFGADTSDQSKGLLVIFNETFLKGLSLDPPPPVIINPVVEQQPVAEAGSTDAASRLKSNLVATLKNKDNIQDFIKSNLSPQSTVSSNSSVNLSPSSTGNPNQGTTGNPNTGTTGNPKTDAKNKVVLSGSSNLNATGNADDNTLVGNSGNNVLDGGSGNDILIGGAGDDRYYVDSVYDTLIELLDEGNDIVFSTVSLILPQNVENLTLSGSATSGTGNELSNSIIGNEFSNDLYGLAGNDILDGQGGQDNLFGGIGNDTYLIDSLDDKVYENLNEGDDTIKISISTPGIYILANNIERVILSEGSSIAVKGNNLSNDVRGNASANILYGDADDREAGNDHILGLGGNDELFGNNGNDYLDGGTGSDTLSGGRGDDIFIVDDIGDIVIEYRAQGQDLVQSSIDFVLPVNVEGLVLTGNSSTKGTGNTLNNSIKGNAGNNLIDGLGGKDTLTGMGGSDTFQFSSKPTFFSSAFADEITDFNPANDRIAISRFAFGITDNTELSFRSVRDTAGLNIALASADVFVYDSSSGNLYWNQNGIVAGAGAGGVFAVLGNKVNLSGDNLSWV